MKNFIKINLAALLSAIILAPTVSAISLEVKTLTASRSTTTVLFSGTTDPGVLAVACAFKDANDNELAFISLATSNNTFSGSFANISSAGSVKCANYNGGTIISASVSVYSAPSIPSAPSTPETPGDNADPTDADPTDTGSSSTTSTSTTKKNNPIKTSYKKKVVTTSAHTLKFRNITLKITKLIKTSKAKGKVTYKKLSGSKKIKVSKSGKITVKKGIKRGTYKVKVAIIANGTAKYKSKALARTVKIKVK